MKKLILGALPLILLLMGLLTTSSALTEASPAGQIQQPAAADLLNSVTIPASADACLKEWAGSYNEGSQPFLTAAYYTMGSTTYVATFLVRFDLASYLPSNAIIDSATLRLYQESCTNFTQEPKETFIGAYFVNDPWSEGTVSWYSRPSSESIGPAQRVRCSFEGLEAYYYNVTSFARAWHDDPQSNYGVELRGPWIGDYSHVFASRESTDPGPELTVTYHLPGPTPTPTLTPTATPACWRLQGKVFDADYPGETQPLQGIDLKLVGSDSSYPASGTQLDLKTTNGDGWYGLWACDAPPTYNYYRIQLQVPTGWEVVNTTTADGEIKGGKKVIQFAWPLQGQDLTGNKFWIRQIPGPTSTPTPTATPRPPEDCENIIPGGSFESGILPPWWTTGSARVNSQYQHDGVKSVLLVEANDQQGELVGAVKLPEGADSITLRYWWRVQTQDPEPHTDFLNVLVEPGAASHQVAYHTADDSPGRWNLEEIDLTAHAGEDTIILFQGHNGPTYPSKWYVDEVEVEVCGLGWGGLKLFVPLVLKG